MTPRVLIADDDAVVRDVVRRYLERDGLEVRVAGDGSEALRVLGTERIDLAVLDVMMPGPSGLSLCRTLRQSGDYSIPVILLTALGEEDDRIAGLEAGADDYLTSRSARASWRYESGRYCAARLPHPQPCRWRSPWANWRCRPQPAPSPSPASRSV